MITAIIVNYHSHLLTARAAASVLADQPDAQVIVVDNSASEAEAQALRLTLLPQAELVVSAENIGFGRACNLGYGQARHEWIFLLNPDAFVVPGCIGVLLEFMQKTPAAGAVSPMVYWDAGLSWFAPPILMHTPVTELGMALLLRQPWLGMRGSLIFRQWVLRRIRSEQPVEREMLSGGHVLVRRSAVEAVGGLFDPAFFMYFEDTDLCRRLRQADFGLFLLPPAQAVHEWCCTQDKSGTSETSRRYYFSKHFPGNWLSAWSRRIEASGLPLHLPPAYDFGLCCAPPVLPVPEALQADWVLELSPQPLLIPALYYFGNGMEARIPDELWQRLGPGSYWARIGDQEGKIGRAHV